LAILFQLNRSVTGIAVEPSIEVAVFGAVTKPGVYSMPIGSRLGDAIDQAGGLTDQADEQRVNPAAPCSDGQKFVIPFKRVPQGNSASKSDPVILELSDPELLLQMANEASVMDLKEQLGLSALDALLVVLGRKETPYSDLNSVAQVPDLSESAKRKFVPLSPGWIE
jgi:competence protein ComEA